MSENSPALRDVRRRGLAESRSTFKGAMGHDGNFTFLFLQTGGGGSKSLTAASASFTWTTKEAGKLSGRGCLYIEAQAELIKNDLKEAKVIELEVS